MGDTENGWKFAQCFGDKGDIEDVSDADVISAVEFDVTGDYLATGDRGGRVVLFERNEGKKSCEYKFYTEFQSHEPEFDYLKSLEIEEKINPYSDPNISDNEIKKNIRLHKFRLFNLFLASSHISSISSSFN